MKFILFSLKEIERAIEECVHLPPTYVEYMKKRYEEISVMYHDELRNILTQCAARFVRWHK